MTTERAIALAEKWSNGLVCSLREGEAAEYHKMFLEIIQKHVAVVRCKDCKNAVRSENAFSLDEQPLYECAFMTEPNRGTEFCSWGIAKDNETS